MINRDNFRHALLLLGFTENGNLLTKVVNGHSMSADFSNETLSYAAGIAGQGRQTSNFSQSENFVVFECVHRLLSKGYKPQHIELEPSWQVGHGASGGRADIIIRDNNRKSLLIIECKTPGHEYTNAWAQTRAGRGQLFSYAQQEGNVDFLALYTSDIETDKVIFTTNIIAHRDNKQFLSENPGSRGFADASSASDRFQIWTDTYKQDYATMGIFEDNINAYEIGKDRYTIADLKSISNADKQKKYHEYATILRQHNISGRENAFDKLVNILLCKLVDETDNPKDLKFYWKGVAYDSHFDIVDRLQQLYQRGMREFLGEDITYVSETDVTNALNFIANNPDATQHAVWKLFARQKFFTNNDFSFLDVHNEDLFYRNAEVLLKVVSMWQDIRLTTDNASSNQFLGDMFEGFLDQGVRQSEGQFFTPMPLCRFIIQSLPLESIHSQSDSRPKIVDYACGAGHFLNEYANQLPSFLGNDADLPAHHNNIYGIEKEYRLSKVAKVSAFMYGQPDINICYADALAQEHVSLAGVENGSFDLLVANPPFSVKGFLSTLPEADRLRYKLSNLVDSTETNDKIEAFFVERAVQLLRPGGVAAIIVPISILTNGDRVSRRARAELLESFTIPAIVILGSGTFGSTGTTTCILFLKRRGIGPAPHEHFADRVNEWFKGEAADTVRRDTYRDEHLIEGYADFIGVSLTAYKSLLQGNPTEELLASPHFNEYKEVFEGSAKYRQFVGRRAFKRMAQDEQQTAIRRKLVDFVVPIEKDKVHHFCLATYETTDTLIVDAGPGATKKDLQRFLGYTWSTTKGDEGIKTLVDANGFTTSPLYSDIGRNDTDKISGLIASLFTSDKPTVPSTLSTYTRFVQMTDLIDFDEPGFSLSIDVEGEAIAPLTSQWPIKKLKEVCSFEYGKGLPENVRNPGGSIPVMGSNGRVGMHDQALVAGPGIVVGRKGSAGKTTWQPRDFWPIDTTFYVLPKHGVEVDLYFLYLSIEHMELRGGGVGVPGLPRTKAYKRELILPPSSVQKDVVAKIQAHEEARAIARGNEDDGRDIAYRRTTMNALLT